jgi:RNA polymerase sigma-70 factor, ECF subfamily
VTATTALKLYDEALPHVYGYLARRCDPATAEDLTAETFMAAVAALRANPDAELGVGWCIGTARHKLVDHWRRTGRQREALAQLWDDVPVAADPGDAISQPQAFDTLATLAPQHRAALLLRYADDLPVAQVADALGRSVEAVESLLTRAKAAFRAAHARLDVRSEAT